MSPRIERICLKALRKDPKQRFAGAAEFAQALRSYRDDMRWSSNRTGMGIGLIGLAPLFVLINLIVYYLLHHYFAEPLLWALICSMYAGLFGVYLFAPASRTGAEYDFSRLELWSIWGGKFFTDVALCLVLRIYLHDNPRDAIWLAYAVITATNGLAIFAAVSKMPRLLYLPGIGGWLTALLIVLVPDWFPLLGGGYLAICVLTQGLFLRKLGQQLS